MLIGIIIVALTVLVCVVVGKLAKTTPDLERFGIRYVRVKHGVLLTAAVPCQFSLTLSRETDFSRKLGKTGLFAEHKTGDAAFDKAFSITALRDDVLDVLRKNASLRKALLQFSERHAGFSSLTVSKGQLSVTVKPAGVDKETVDALREALSEQLPAFTQAFQHVPANTPEQAAKERAGTFAAVAPLVLFMVLLPFAIWYAVPIATGSIPWAACIVGGVLLGAIGCGLVFALTKEGTVRMQGVLSALLLAAVSIPMGMPYVASAVNALTAKPASKEVVLFEKLTKHTPRKGASHYYLHLGAPLASLQAGGDAAHPSLEIESGKYYALMRAHLAPGSRLEVEESEGLLGQPFVSKITVLPGEPVAN